MLRKLLALVLSTAAASAVAVNPYEPLPKSSTQSQSRPSYSAPASKPVPAASSATTDNDSGMSYSAAVDNGNQNASGGAAFSWDTMSQMQQLQQEVLQLRGQVEELNHQIEVMQKQERERYLDLDMRINQLQTGKPVAGSEAATPMPTVSGDDKTLYEKASQLRKDGKYPEAIAILEQLLTQSPKGVYAPYCEYWLGELDMVTEPPDLDKAKRHFINLLANHGDHVKVPDAMYKLGKLYAAKDETDKAKSTLNALIKKYPDKSAAKLAKDLLKTL